MEDKMEICITAEDYFNELKLMQKQYGQEEDLYPWVYMFLQMAKAKSINENISIRTVAGGRKAKSVNGRKLIKAFGAFPDFAVLAKDFDKSMDNENLNKLYGCVEVKKLSGEALKFFKNDETYKIRVRQEDEKKSPIMWTVDNKKEGSAKKIYKRYTDKNKEITDDGELLAEVLWYGKVLYTNGLCWKLLSLDKIVKSDNTVPELRNFRENIIKEIQNPSQDCRKKKKYP